MTVSIPKNIENHVIQYAKHMKKARQHQEKLNNWLSRFDVKVDGNNEWVLDQIIDIVEYGTGDAEEVLANIEELLSDYD